jgi:DNA-binding beta-propeller fold protein YncE
VGAIGFVFSLWLASAGIPQEPPATPKAAEPIPYTTTWIGNSHGRADGKWVQNNILGLYVAPSGTVYTNSWWDEGRRESGIYAGADGDPFAALESLHDSFGGGFAVTGDAKYIYASNWDTVRRCHPDGRRAPFPGGQGKEGDTIDVSTAPTGKDKSIGVRGLAMDAAGRRLFISESTDGEVEVWDAEKMTFLRKWKVPRPGPLAIAADHSVWVISRKEGDAAARILHFTADGKPLPDVITGPRGFDPTGIWFDPVRKRLLVADNGPEQNIKIYVNLAGARDLPDATFGRGVFTGLQERSRRQVWIKRADGCRYGRAREHLCQHEWRRTGIFLARRWNGAGILDPRRKAALAQSRAGVCRLRRCGSRL